MAEGLAVERAVQVMTPKDQRVQEGISAPWGLAGRLAGEPASNGYRPCPLVPSQSWADAFRSSPDLTGVVAVYEDLRRKGLEFPMTDLDMLSPIHTPQRVRSGGQGWRESPPERVLLPGGPDLPASRIQLVAF